jgi:hypothetical protein
MSDQSKDSSGTRAGGDVVIKGASKDEEKSSNAPATRAGGDVVIKGASKENDDEDNEGESIGTSA